VLDKTVQFDQAVSLDQTVPSETARRAPPAGGISSAAAAERTAAASADRAALAIRAALDRLTGSLARAAASFVRLRAWSVFGFARLEDHARERYGRSGRWLRDLAALGDGIAASPALADALIGSDGGPPLGRVAATLVARAAGLSPIDTWIAAARSLSVRDLRAAIHPARAEAATGSDADADTAPSASHSDTSADSATDPDEDRALLRLPAPLPVLAAFEEALELHRAVEGGSSSVVAFVEALVGEAQSAGTVTSPGFVAPLEHGTPEAQVEAVLRRATDAWAHLPEPVAPPAPGASSREPHAVVAEAGAAVAEAEASLRLFSALEAEAGQGDATALDRQIGALVRIENELEAELGRLLAAMAERRDWQRLRFAGVGHYAEERLGMSRSRAGERARLARALRPLPAVAAACATGRITMEAAALIHRILSDPSSHDRLSPGSTERGPDEIETAWVEHAATTTIKRMRDEARALGLYRARTYAAVAGSAAAPPRPLQDNRWVESLRREAGTATRRIIELGLRAAGLVPQGNDPEPDVFHSPAVDPAAPPTEPDVFQALLPEPDVFLRLRLPADLAADFLAAIEAARAAVEARVASSPWDAEWPAPTDEAAPSEMLARGTAMPPSEHAAEPPSAWAARIAFVRGRSVPTWVGLLALLEDFAATWDTDEAAPERRDDRIFIRDGWRCAAPGCSSRRNLEDHHVVYRSRGGSDYLVNRVTLCRFHHQRGEHGGLMSVRGKAPLGLTWRLGRADVAVVYRAERLMPGSPSPT
jgi:hypothetical protein